MTAPNPRPDAPPRLRLVGQDATPRSTGRTRSIGRAPADLTRLIPRDPSTQRARIAVASETRQAAALPGADARHLIYQATASAIEGGQAAILRPERRAQVLNLATRVGLRPFDANLVIAIAQDAARRGECQPNQPPASVELVSPPSSTRGWTLARALMIALGLALAMLGGFISWLRMG